MTEKISINYVKEDELFASSLSNKLEQKSIQNIMTLLELSESNIFLQTIVILSKNYFTQWEKITEERSNNISFDETKLIVLVFDGGEIPKEFKNALILPTSNSTDIETLASRIWLHLKGYLKNKTNAPLASARNLM